MAHSITKANVDDFETPRDIRELQELYSDVAKALMRIVQRSLLVPVLTNSRFTFTTPKISRAVPRIVNRVR